MNKLNFKPPFVKNDMSKLLAANISGKKVSIFIDAANLYHAASVAKLRIDFVQIAKWFKQKSNLVALNFYTAFDPEDDRQLDFFKKLELAGYSIIKKPLKRNDNLIKGNMDIELAVDAIMQAKDYEILILLSGDGDFFYLVDTLEGLGNKTVILGVGGFTSFELHKKADSYFFLNRIADVWRTPKPKIESEPIYVVSTDDFEQAYKHKMLQADYEGFDTPFEEIKIPVKQERRPRKDAEKNEDLKDLNLEKRPKNIQKTIQKNVPKPSLKNSKLIALKEKAKPVKQKNIRFVDHNTPDLPKIMM
jgi:uncharacterized LabA/DUF88 family protein